MGHTKPADLEDLQDLLDQLRAWDGIREKSKNVFYYKSAPFLHFHDKDGKRWADIRSKKNWDKLLKIPFNATARQKAAFLEAVGKCYRSLL